MKPILAVDDDELVLKSVRQVLEDEGFEVVAVKSGQEALDYVSRQIPSLIILDVIMPGLSGFDVCQRIKADPILARIPVIFLTAKGRPIDEKTGLDMGADDFITKPYEVLTLPSRVRAILRRFATSSGEISPDQSTLDISVFSLHLNYPRIDVRSQSIDLTTTEHRLAYYLMKNAGDPVSVDLLLQNVWEYPPGVGDPNLVRVHIANLRAKLAEIFDDHHVIVNVRGKGYMFAPHT
jgi:DNA-binding response OmpR family regulator